VTESNTITLENVKDTDNLEKIISKLEKLNIFFIVRQDQNNLSKLFFTSQIKFKDTTVSIASEMLFAQGSDKCKITSKSYPEISFLSLYENDLTNILV
jgi:hypothetical protein